MDRAALFLNPLDYRVNEKGGSTENDDFAGHKDHVPDDRGRHPERFPEDRIHGGEPFPCRAFVLDHADLFLAFAERIKAGKPVCLLKVPVFLLDLQKISPFGFPCTTEQQRCRKNPRLRQHEHAL